MEEIESVSLSALTSDDPRDLVRFTFHGRKIVFNKMNRRGFHDTWEPGTRPHTSPESDEAAQVLVARVSPERAAMYAEAGHRRGDFPRFPVAPPEEGVPDWVPRHGIPFKALDLAAFPSGHARLKPGRTRFAFDHSPDAFFQLNCFVWTPPESGASLDPQTQSLISPESEVRWIRTPNIWLGLEISKNGTSAPIRDVDA